MRRIWTALMIALPLLLVASPGVSVFAQGGDSTFASPSGLMLFTRYPAQEAAIGESVAIALTLRTDTAAQVVRLELQGLPTGWTANFRGGGRVVHAAYVEPKSDTDIDLRVDPPKDAQAGAYKMTVIGRSDDGQQLNLPIELTLTEKAPPSLTFEVELPTLMGAPGTTLRYYLTLKNEGDADLSVNLLTEAPQGFQVGFKLGGQDVTNIPVAANESKMLTVEANPFPDVPAGSYPITVQAQGGQAQATLELVAQVTGQAKVIVTAPDGRLSGQAYVGAVSPIKVIIANTGSESARNIGLSATQPSGWAVQFDPPQVAEVPAGKQVEVTANIKPADQAIAGDYNITVHAQPEDSPSQSADFRITVLTSTLWGVVGVGLIAVAVLVVGLAVMRFGRR